MEQNQQIFILNDLEGNGVDFIQTTADETIIQETFDEYVYGEQSKIEEGNIVECLIERGYEAFFLTIETINY